MVKVTFVNAVVRADGYSIKVNGEDLVDILSTALGTKAGEKRAGYKADLPDFKSNCCNITITIDPQPVYASIEDDEEIYDSVEELEVARLEQYEKAKETATES